MSERTRSALLLALALVLVALAYLPGLNGPFLFDDAPNIVNPLKRWLDGSSNWQQFVFDNQSGPLGRIVSMLSFAFNGATTGLEVWPFKLTNLLLHFACALVGFALLARLLRQDSHFAPRAAQIGALLIAAIWLLHPIQVSTVLYVVQRMAQLSTLFALIALWAFVSGREALLQSRLRAALACLFGLVPLATLMAVGSKENGALVPVLCAVIEIAYFRSRSDLPALTAHGRRVLQVFLWGFIILPLLAATAFLAVRPEFFLGGYDARLFTFGERLLSEPRAVLDYVGILLFPRGASLGVYTDDFITSTGLLSPPSTLFSILILSLWALLSIALRKRARSFFAGTWLFFGAHAMESSIFPLELYFEHRNYLPSFGLFLAVAGLVQWGLPALRAQLPERSRHWPFVTAAILIVLALAASTAIRSSVWQSWATIAEQGVRQHPTSRRAHLDKVSILLELKQADAARDTLVHMLDFPDPMARSAASWYLVWLDCRDLGEVAPAEVARLAALSGSTLQLADLFGAEGVGRVLLNQECIGLGMHDFGALLAQITANDPQRASNTVIWRLRFVAARMFAGAGELAQAIEQAELAWQTGKADPAVGILLAHLYNATGATQKADALIDVLRKRIPPRDEAALAKLEEVLDWRRRNLESE